MTVFRRIVSSPCIAPFLICALVFCTRAVAAQQRERDERAEQAVEIARQDPRVEDVLTDFPEIRLEPSYLERYGVWQIEMLVGDRGEVGLVTVSLERGEVVEFDFNIDEVREVGHDDDEREQPVSVGTLLWRFRPHFEGPAIAWLSIVLVFLFVGNFTRIISRRNLDIVLLYSLCPFFNILWANRAAAYTGIFVATILLFIRCMADLGIRRNDPVETGNLGPRAACLVLALAALFHIQSTYERGIDDSGIWSVMGARYMQETGRLPYGTAFGWNCVYGPLMYALHIPANWVFPPDVSFEPDGGGAEIGGYGRFEMRGAQSVVLMFDFLAMLGLYLFGRRYGNKATGILLALVYALNPYVIGMGAAGGLQWTSHITGIAFVVFALVLASRPLSAGLLLGIGCGMLYYPVFLFPLWCGYYVRTAGWKDAVKFLAPIAVVGLVCLALIMALTVPNDKYEHKSRLHAFLNDTVLQQQFKDGYGTSEFSFWGQHPGIGRWGKPLVGILYLLFCAGLAFIPRRMDMKRLVALTAAVLIGTQLILSHGGGTYIGFYIAPLIITLLGPETYPELPNRPKQPEQMEVELS